MRQFGKWFGFLCGGAVIATTVAASADAVRGKGRVMYYQNGSAGGAYLPLAGAKVHLMDEDIGFDDTIRNGSTDENGYFDLSGSGDDLWGTPDPYVQVELESPSGHHVVESEIFKINLTCSTATRNNKSGTIEFGTFHCLGDSREGSAVFARLRQAYAKYTALTGDPTIPRHGGKAAVLYPATFAAGVPWTTEESIHWPGGYKTYASIFHEFGHRIRHAQDGDFAHFLADVVKYSYPQQHWTKKVTNEGFAFNEGWAEYNAAINGADDFSSWVMVNGGANNVEGNVAAKLWKASTSCGGFGRMWTTLQAGNIHGWSDFSNKLKATFNASAALKAAHPSCLGSLVAMNDPAPALDLFAAPGRMLASADVPALLGAFAPSGGDSEGPKASAADQAAVLARMGADAKQNAARRSFRNRFGASAPLGRLGGQLAQNRQTHEVKVADKLARHAAKLTPIEANKEAVEKRQAEHEAFRKEIVQDRIDLLDAQMKEFAAEKRKGLQGRDAQQVDKEIARYTRIMGELRAALRTGELKREYLPSSFSQATEAAPTP